MKVREECCMYSVHLPLSDVKVCSFNCTLMAWRDYRRQHLKALRHSVSHKGLYWTPEMQQASPGLIGFELQVILGRVYWNWITMDPSTSPFQAGKAVNGDNRQQQPLFLKQVFRWPSWKDYLNHFFQVSAQNKKKSPSAPSYREKIE